MFCKELRDAIKESNMVFASSIATTSQIMITIADDCMSKFMEQMISSKSYAPPPLAQPN